MARPSFRDRFLTPPVARAILSPLGMVLFGAGTAAGILFGAPVVAAAAVGAAAWGTRVLAAVPRGTVTKVEPFALGEPWRTYVVEAQTSKKRFDNVLRGMSPGPIRDRLSTMDGRLDDAITESWKIAHRGHEITEALRSMTTSSAEADLATIRFRLGPNGRPSASETNVMAALQSQIDASDRLQATADSAMERLGVLDARFDELVARAIEVSVGAGDSTVLGDDVDGLVTELEALRTAIDETAAVDGPGLPGTGLTST